MQEIFMLLWLADTVHSVSITANLAVLVLSIALFIGYMVLYNLSPAYREEEGEFKAVLRGLWPYWVVCVMLSVVVPSKQTVQVLALTKASELAASSVIGQKITDTLSVVLEKIKKEASK